MIKNIKEIYSKCINNNKIITTIIVIILAIITLIISTKFSLIKTDKSSIATDSGVFLTIGAQMHEGKVPYRDIFDHKGPLLYFYNYLGTFEDTYRIVFMIEFISLFVTVIFMYKIGELISGSKIVSITTTIFAIYTLMSFLQGGNLTEEYALPFITSSLYIFIKLVKDKKVSIIEKICLGISLGAVCLLRINMIVVWGVYYLAIGITFLIKKQYKELIEIIKYTIIGVLIIFIPFVIYLGMNSAIDDFINNYLMFNFKYAGFHTYGRKALAIKWIEEYKIIPITIILNVIYSIVYLTKKSWHNFKISGLALLYELLSFLIVILPGNDYPHYLMIMIPCLIIPISLILKTIYDFKKIFIYILICFAIIIFVKQYRKVPIYNFKENIQIGQYIKENTNSYDDVLVVGNQCAIYLVSERNTNCKYIYQSPVAKFSEEIEEEFQEYMKNNKPKVIVLKKVLQEELINEYVVNNSDYHMSDKFSNIYFYVGE